MPDQSMIERTLSIKGLPMTVADLRAHLATFPDDALVLVPGYEGDYTLAIKPMPGRYGPSGRDEDEWWMGDWAEADGETPDARDCIVISGERGR